MKSSVDSCSVSIGGYSYCIKFIHIILFFLSYLKMLCVHLITQLNIHPFF